MENIEKKNLIMGHTSRAIEKLTGIAVKEPCTISDYRIARNTTIVTIENVIETIHDIPVQYYHDPRTNYSSIKFSYWVSSHRSTSKLTEKERFLSYIWISLLECFDDIVTAELTYRDNQDDDIIIAESYHPYYGNYIEKIDVFLQLISDLQVISIECLYNGKPIIDFYKKIMEMVSIQKGNDFYFHKKLKYIKTVKEQVSILKDSQSVSMFGYQLDDDIIINNICKISYVLLTGSSDLSHTGKVEEGITFDDKYEIGKFIKRLGKDIRECVGSISNLEHNLIPFKSYTKTRPKNKFRITTDLTYDMDFKLGYTALNYMAFILDSPDINGILNRMGD